MAMLWPVERLRPLEFLRRLGIAFGICVAPMVAVGFAIAFAAKQLGFNPGVPQMIALPVVAVIAYRFYVRRIEKRPLSELSSDGAARELGGGLLTGAALFTTVIAVIAAAGSYTVTGLGTLTGPAFILLASIAAGVMEEIIFRGIIFRLTESAFGTLAAMAASAVLFGAAHVFSPHPTLLALVAIALEAGILLACAYVVTRRLWFPIGIHAAWNFAQGGVFGMAVSGNRSKGWLEGVTSGPEWLTGGEFGPEASLVSIVVCFALAVVLFRRARARSLVVGAARG